MNVLSRRPVLFASLLLFVATQGYDPFARAAPATPDSLSGNYRLHFEQTSKSCSAMISPVDTNVTLTFSDSSVTMKFPQGFLGIQLLEASYDPKKGKLQDRLEKRVSLGPTQATLVLDIDGNVKRSQIPEVRYEIVFDKIADDPAWNCKVTGKGSARKL